MIFLDQYNKVGSAAYKPPIRVGTAANKGEVVLGTIGAQADADYYALARNTHDQVIAAIKAADAVEKASIALQTAAAALEAARKTLATALTPFRKTV